LAERTEAEKPLRAVVGGDLLDHDVVCAERVEKPVSLVGPVDAIESRFDAAVEVHEVGNGGMLAGSLFELFGIAVAFLPEIRDETAVNGHELSEFDTGLRSREDLPEHDVLGINAESGDDAHRSPLPFSGPIASWLYV
jgi:hypothetical protein